MAAMLIGDTLNRLRDSGAVRFVDGKRLKSVSEADPSQGELGHQYDPTRAEGRTNGQIARTSKDLPFVGVPSSQPALASYGTCVAPNPEVMNPQKASGYIVNSLSQPIRSVLVVDDDAEALFALSQLMSALGVQKVRRASSAEIALEILQTEKVSLIVSDYRLNGMDGVEFLERLRGEGNRTPVVMVSGAPDKEGVIRATRHERVDFFAKPFRVIELAGAMERLLAA